MTSLSPTFSVFHSKPSLQAGNDSLILCSSKGAKVRWPKVARRGRPRKDLLNHGSSVKKETGVFSKSLFEFVEYAQGMRPKEPHTQRLVRAHVMRNYVSREQSASQKRSEMGVVGNRNSIDGLEPKVEPRDCVHLSLERWTTDPFNSFPMDMEPCMYDLLYVYVSAVAEDLFSIEGHWGMNPAKAIWVPLAMTDPVLMSAILCSVDQFRARMSGQKERPSAVQHLKQAIQVLNGRLQSPLQEISDSTIAAVAGLALTEQSSGNQANWRIHMEGIKRMLEIRGGSEAFEHNSFLLDKLYRADICGSIHDLTQPYLRIEAMSFKPRIFQDQKTIEATLSPGFQAIFDQYGFDTDIHDALCKIRMVTQDMNTLSPPRSEIIPLELRRTIRSVQYCLLSKDKFTASNGAKVQVIKACSFGVLLYLGIIQNDLRVSPISTLFLSELKSLLAVMRLSSFQKILSLRLWLLFLAGLAVYDPIERASIIDSISHAISQLSLTTWDDTKNVLESFAWTGKIQNKAGGLLWEQAVRCHHESRD